MDVDARHRRRRRDPPGAGRAAGEPGRRARRRRPSAPAALPRPASGEAVLATWHHLIDLGSLLDGDEVLAGTARPPVVRIGKGLAEALGVADGDAGHGRHRPRRDHPAGRDHRPARAGGVAADELAGLDACAAASASPRVRSSGSRAGQPGPILAQAGDTHELDDPRAGQDPTLQTFGNDVWWIVLIKVRRRLRVPGAADAVHDLVRAQGRGPDGRSGPGPNQVGPVRPAAVASPTA